MAGRYASSLFSIIMGSTDFELTKVKGGANKTGRLIVENGKESARSPYFQVGVDEEEGSLLQNRVNRVDTYSGKSRDQRKPSRQDQILSAPFPIRKTEL